MRFAQFEILNYRFRNLAKQYELLWGRCNNG